MSYIAEFGGKYCLWSGVMDAPETRLMTEGELFDHLTQANPQFDRDAFQMRMARVREFGCSGGLYGFTKAALLADNRAGPGETHVATEEEMMRLYSAPDNKDCP